MKQKDYPEKIYANTAWVRDACSGSDEVYYWTYNKDKSAETSQEYIRADTIKWHKYLDEEPLKNQEVLMQKADGAYVIDMYDYRFYNDIVAWMKLPEPYKEKYEKDRLSRKNIRQ